MKRSIMFLLMAMALSVLVSPQAWAVGTTAGTSIQNQAYSDYKDANGNSLPRVYSNTVTTTVSQVGGLLLEPKTGSKTGTAGTGVYYAATVHNEGNGADVFDLTATNDTTGWITTIYRDDNQDGIWDSATETTVITTTGSIAADGQEYVIVVVTVPSGADPEDSSIATLTATSQFDISVTDSSAFTTTALAAALEITKTASPTAPEDGDIVTYAITGKNLGTDTALNITFTDVIPANTTYVAESMRVGPIGGSYASATPYTDASDADPTYYNSGSGQVELDWGDEDPYPPNGTGTGGVFYFQVRVNDDVPAGTGIENTGTATYQLSGNPNTYSTQSNESSVTVDSDASVLLDPDSSLSGDPSDQIVYEFTVYNNGNATDVIDLTYTSNSGWTYTFWEDVDQNGIPGTDGDYILTDTDADGKIDTGGITQGDSIPLLAVVTIPAGTADGTTETAVVTGTSSIEPGDADGSDTVTLTTTVTAPVLNLTKSVSPTGSQPPGTELTYTVTAANNGTGAATAVVISDIIPTYTTYKASSIKAGTTVGTLTAKTDANDGDGARYDSGSDAVIVPDGSSLSLGPGGTYVVQFTVTID